MLDLSKDRPICFRDLEDLLYRLSTEDMYISSEKYRKEIAHLSRTQYAYLKKIGALNPGIHPATRNSRRILVHRFYNIKARKIIWFPSQEITPLKKKDTKNVVTKSRKALQQQNLSKHSQQSLEKAGEYNMEESIEVKQKEVLPQQQQQELQSSTINSLTRAGGKNDEAV
jgi:hypothetical protein